MAAARLDGHENWRERGGQQGTMPLLDKGEGAAANGNAIQRPIQVENRPSDHATGCVGAQQSCHHLCDANSARPEAGRTPLDTDHRIDENLMMLLACTHSDGLKVR